MSEEPKETTNPDPKCLAVCANRDDCPGIALWYSGFLIEQEVSHLSAQLEDLGLHDAPDGISVWEGTYRYTQGSEPDDIDAEPDGEFRAPTDEEWSCIMNGKTPWALVTEAEDSEHVADDNAGQIAVCTCSAEDGPDCPFHNPSDLFPRVPREEVRVFEPELDEPT